MNATSRFTKSSRAIRRWTVVASLAVSVLVVPGLTGSSVEARGAANLVAKADTLVGSASAYRPINPIRILDTRSDPGIKRLWIGSAFSIDPITTTGVAEAAGVNAADITAVIVNTTLVKTGSRGFGTVWPTGSKRQVTSTNNAGFEGHTIPNLVIAPLGLDQKISVYSSMTSDIILDHRGRSLRGPRPGSRIRLSRPRHERLRRRQHPDHRPHPVWSSRRCNWCGVERDRDQVQSSRVLSSLVCR
jgi:hypothetical protein